MTWDHTIFFVKAQVFWIRLSEPSPFSCYRLQEGHIFCIVIGKMVVPFWDGTLFLAVNDLPRSPLKGNIPNKYPLYKVYMGLFINSQILFFGGKDVVSLCFGSRWFGIPISDDPRNPKPPGPKPPDPKPVAEMW